VGSLGYTGALSDSSGLVYLQARSLDPASGTFTSRDPLTPGGPGITGFNPYAYAGQNPTTYTDPGGRMSSGYVAALTPAASAPWWLPLLAEGITIALASLVIVCELGHCPLPWPDTRPWDRPWDATGEGTTAIPWGRSIPIPVARPLPKEIPWALGPLVQVWRAVSSAENRSQFNWSPSRNDIDGLSGTLAGVPPFPLLPEAPLWFMAATGHLPVAGVDRVRGAFLTQILAAGFSVDWTPTIGAGGPLPYHVSIGRLQLADGAPGWRGTASERAALRARLESLFVIPVWPL